MDPVAQTILTTWQRNRDYALALLDDLAPEQIVAQPIRGITMNHPAWIISHLNAYAPIAAALLRRDPIEDPADHPFGRKSKPINDTAAYPPKDQLVAEYTRLHDDARHALEQCDPAIFAEPVPLERWRSKAPTVGDMVVTLMVKHESMHLGQLSAWRRAMGLPPVSM